MHYGKLNIDITSNEPSPKAIYSFQRALSQIKIHSELPLGNPSLIDGNQ